MTELLYCHVCPDGHTWLEQADGGVSPSYGYGGTSITWRGYDPRTCPEPERHNGHGYLCARCGVHWFAGSCDCKTFRPPKPVCRKAPFATFIWSPGTPASRRRGEPHGWGRLHRAATRPRRLAGVGAAGRRDPRDRAAGTRASLRHVQTAFLEQIEPYVATWRMKQRIETARWWQQIKAKQWQHRTEDDAREEASCWQWMRELNSREPGCLRDHLPEPAAVKRNRALEVAR